MSSGKQGISWQSQLLGLSSVSVLLAQLSLFGFIGCSRAMRDDGRTKPFEAANRRSTVLIPPSGRIARGHLHTNETLWVGKSGTNFAVDFPLQLSRSLLERGQQRYEIYCAPCHDSLGSGRGMIVQRGFKQPVPFSDERLRKAPIGYFFESISRGYKTMLPMASQIPVEDRWAIVAYVRALQRSQRASLSDVPPKEKQRLEGLP